MRVNIQYRQQRQFPALGRFVGVLALAVCFVSVLCATASPVLADPLYKVYGRRGSVTFTTRKPTDGRRYHQVSRKRPIRSRWYRSRGRSLYPIASRFDSLIAREARKQRLEPALVKAVVHAESAFDPKATSHKGAMGLMQLMPGTARRMGVDDAYKPSQNVKGGTKYLKWLMDRYKGDVKLALAAYNAGEGVVDRLRAIPPYDETIRYVRKVLALFKLYKKVDGTS